MPYRDTRPYVGLMPEMPQKPAGCRIDPPVSVPVAHGASRAATAAAEPPEEPPGTRAGSQGLRAGPKYEFSVDEPIANSSRLVLPRITAPAAPNCSMTCASYGATKLARILDPQVVSHPRAQKMSLCATGIPR